MTNNKKKKTKGSLQPRGSNKSKTPAMPLTAAVSHRKTVSVKSSTNQAGEDFWGSYDAPTTEFTSSFTSVQPGINFPGLGHLAERYDRYKFLSLSFEWRPNKAVTTTPGTVSLYWEPNADSATPLTLSQVMSAEHSLTFPVYASKRLSIPTSRLGPVRYIRSGSISTTKNIYDTGQFGVVLNGVTAGTDIGYIVVKYNVQFYDYHLPPAPVNMSSTNDMVLRESPRTIQLRSPPMEPIVVASNSTVEVTEWNTTSTFGGEVTSDTQSVLVDGGDIFIPPGNYRVDIQLRHGVRDAPVRPVTSWDKVGSLKVALYGSNNSAETFLTTDSFFSYGLGEGKQNPADPGAYPTAFNSHRFITFMKNGKISLSISNLQGAGVVCNAVIDRIFLSFTPI